MKKLFGKLMVAFGSSVVLLSACQKEDQPLADPTTVDVRPLFVGSYICDVKKTNMQTETLLASYQDTIEIVTRGADQLLINNLQRIQLLEVKYLYNYANPMFVSLGTIVTIDKFDNNRLNIIHGHDTAFYELKGIRKP